MDEVPEAIANMIKAVAFLLEEAVVAKYTDQITNQLSPATINNDTSTQLKETLDRFNTNLQEQMESLGKVIEEIKATPIPQHMVTSQLLTNPEYSYRDALMGNQNPTSTSLANFHEAKLQNRININAHQILIEI